MIASGILKEDLILPDGTKIPNEEIDWDYPLRQKNLKNDNPKQTNTEGDLCELVGDVLDDEAELDRGLCQNVFPLRFTCHLFLNLRHHHNLAKSKSKKH